MDVKLENKFYTIEEVAEIFRVRTRTIYRWIEIGHLKAERINPRGAYRISKSMIEKTLKDASYNN